MELIILCQRFPNVLEQIFAQFDLDSDSTYVLWNRLLGREPGLGEFVPWDRITTEQLGPRIEKFGLAHLVHAMQDPARLKEIVAQHRVVCLVDELIRKRYWSELELVLNVTFAKTRHNDRAVYLKSAQKVINAGVIECLRRSGFELSWYDSSGLPDQTPSSISDCIFTLGQITIPVRKINLYLGDIITFINSGYVTNSDDITFLLKNVILFKIGYLFSLKDLLKANFFDIFKESADIIYFRNNHGIRKCCELDPDLANKYLEQYLVPLISKGIDLFVVLQRFVLKELLLYGNPSKANRKILEYAVSKTKLRLFRD